MEKFDLKNIIKGPADLDCVKAGGIATYKLTAEDNSVYLLEINLSDLHDVGATSTFMAHYDKSLILMRWIRRAIDNGTLIKIS